MSKNKKYIDETVSVENTTIINDTVEEVTSVEMNTTVFDEPTQKIIPIGIIYGCAKLNVRKEPKPDAEVVSQLVVGSEVMIDCDTSTDEFYKVCTASGVEGFCMKRFVTIQ